MSDGHRHRHVTVKRDGLVVRVLRGIIVHRSANIEHVENSRLIYRGEPDSKGRYPLSLLGLLHGATGLTLDVHTPEELERDT